VGLAAVVGFGWLFGGITEDVIKGDELAARDSPVAAWLAEHRVGWLTATMRAITQLGSLRIIAPLVALTALPVNRSPRFPTLLYMSSGSG
jgi:hypothetical protein